VESVTFPDNVEEIGVRVLSECPNLKRIYLGAGVRLIDLHAFSECDLDEIVISPENPHLVFRDGCVIDTAAKTLILGIRGAVIPGDGSVERIGYSAFSGRRGISSLIIPEGIKEICSFAFEGCDVERIALPKSIEKLGTSTLRDCKYLKSFDLGGYSELPDYSLDGCDALREVTGLENVTRIGKYALSVGADLHSIRLTSSLKSIDEYACLKASSLNRIYFDGTVEQWNAISKGKGWNLRTPDTRIICNDGEV
jgi:hypothetical protein